MKSLLANAKKIDVCAEPYPFIVIHEPLDTDICEQLMAEYPSMGTVTNGAKYASNQRFSYSASEVFGNEAITPLWREFVETHTSQTFLNEVIHLFDDQIRTVYPDLEAQIGALETLKAGVRKINTFENADVLMDAQICVNTPVVGAPSSVRRAHVDLPNKLFAGLFYMRRPEDDSTGGDLELYRFKDRRDRFRAEYISERFVEVAKTVKYERNVLIMFINSIDSVHGVTVRSKTHVQRQFFNLVGEVNCNLFNLADFQEKPGWLERSAAVPAKALRGLRKMALQGVD